MPRAPATKPPPSATAADDRPVRLLRQFRIVFNAVKSHFQQVERELGLGGAQVWALNVIREQPGIGVNELAAALDVRQPTASNLVKSLVQQGLVEARREGSDRRTVQLHALPAARQLLRRTPGPAAGVLAQALAQLEPELQQRLEQDLAQLIEQLGARRRGAAVPLAEIAGRQNLSRPNPGHSLAGRTNGRGRRAG